MNQAISDHSLPPLEPDNDPGLVLRAKRAVDALKADRSPIPTEGDILGWVVMDRQTGEWCVSCKSRREARDLAGADGVIGKILRAH